MMILHSHAASLSSLCIIEMTRKLKIIVGAVAKTIVNMEQSYVTAAFFRHRTAERYKAMMQAQQTARLLGEGRKKCIYSFTGLWAF